MNLQAFLPSLVDLNSDRLPKPKATLKLTEPRASCTLVPLLLKYIIIKYSSLENIPIINTLVVLRTLYLAC